MDMADHGLPAIVADAFTKGFQGVEIGFSGRLAAHLAEEVVVHILQFVASPGTIAEVPAMGLGDFGESGIVEMVFLLQPCQTEVGPFLTGSQIHGIVDQTESAVGKQDERGKKRQQAWAGRVCGHLAANGWWWWESSGLIALM